MLQKQSFHQVLQLNKYSTTTSWWVRILHLIWMKALEQLCEICGRMWSSEKRPKFCLGRLFDQTQCTAKIADWIILEGTKIKKNLLDNESLTNYKMHQI